MAPLLSSQSSHLTFTCSPSNNIASFLSFHTTKLKMMSGKRPRHNFKRTTSMSEITFDLNNTTIHEDSPHNIFTQNHVLVSYGGHLDQTSFYTTPPSRPNRRASADFLETPHFLRSCGLCKRKLVPGRDVYMYRGDSAYCSHECREHQMDLDERKDKCGMVSKKKEVVSSSSVALVFSKAETAAAV